jgi:nucleotide-binding universal stress UspA family protein
MNQNLPTRRMREHPDLQQLNTAGQGVASRICSWGTGAVAEVGLYGGRHVHACDNHSKSGLMASAANVFISYASDTKPLAEELTKELESQGIEPWVDFKDLHPGQRWSEELERAIEEAQWVLVLVGSDSRATPWQEAEWRAVLAHTWVHREKRLLPIVFGQDDPPPFLRNWVALRVNPDTEASTWTRKVIDVLRNLRKEPVHPGQKSREERQKRLEEIQQAAEGLRELQPDTLPAEPDSSK